MCIDNSGTAMQEEQEGTWEIALVGSVQLWEVFILCVVVWWELCTFWDMYTVGCALCSALCIMTAVKNNYPKESAEGAKHKLQRPKPKRFGLQEKTFRSSRQNNQGQ